MIGLLKIFGLGRFAADLLREERQRGESLIDCLNRLRDEAAQWRAYGMSKPQPAPKNQDGPAIWPMVISHLREMTSDPIFARIADDAQERHEFGVKKYGVPLVAENGRNHLRDAYQEQLDKVVYLRAHHEQSGYGYDAYIDSLNEAAELRRALDDK